MWKCNRVGKYGKAAESKGFFKELAENVGIAGESLSGFRMEGW